MQTSNTSFLPFTRTALVMALAFVGSPQASIIKVNASCSLYNAIMNANTDTDIDGNNSGCTAGNGADIITLPVKSTQLLLNAGNDNGLPIITSTITILGNRSTVDAQGLRGFNINSSGNLTLNKLTIKKGSAVQGAGILNNGQLALVDSTVSGNSTYTTGDYYLFGSEGAGIFNSGTATLTNSRVIDNSAYAGYSINGDSGRGGGILNTSSGKMTLTRCIVSGNETTGTHIRSSGPIGGGILNYGTMSISNSTISGNTASDEGGGIRNRGVMTLSNSTVSGNTSVSGGGIYNGFFLNFIANSLTIINSTITKNSASGGAGIFNNQNASLTNSTLSGNIASNSGGGIANKGTIALNHTTVSGNHSAKTKGGGVFNLHNMSLSNTLIANSLNGGDCVNNSGAVTTLQGINLIEDGSCDADIGGDPKLGALLDNGGATATHALLANSPALDSANKPLCALQDQRGVKRPQPVSGNCDIGAFESIPTVPNTIVNAVLFFDNALVGGGLVGVGRTAIANQRSNAFRNQLLVAGHLKSQDLNTDACQQLRMVITRIDTDSVPDNNDYITGSQATALSAELAPLFGTWACQ